MDEVNAVDSAPDVADSEGSAAPYAASLDAPEQPETAATEGSAAADAEAQDGIPDEAAPAEADAWLEAHQAKEAASAAYDASCKEREQALDTYLEAIDKEQAAFDALRTARNSAIAKHPRKA